MTATKTIDLLALAERCENAAGPDRELDWLMADTLGEIPEHSVAESGTPYGWFRRPGEVSLWQTKESDPHAGINLWQPVARTASLDAAMTLVPEGLKWGIGNPQDGHSYATMGGLERAVRAATPALALCAAALRAMEASNGQS